MRGSACGMRFTLVELLVVIAIIAILASLLLPALGQVRERVKQAQCANNEKTIGGATIMYADDYEGYFPPMKSNGEPDTWQKPLAVYLNITWNVNKPTPQLYRCPSQTATITRDPANYDCMMKGDYGASRTLCNIFEDNNGFSGGAFNYIRIHQVAFPSTAIWLGDEVGCWQRDISSSDYANPSSSVYRHSMGDNFNFVDNHVDRMTYLEMGTKGYLKVNNWRFGWRDGLVY